MQYIPGWLFLFVMISVALGAVFHGVAAIIRALLSGRAEIIRAERGLPEPKPPEIRARGAKILGAIKAD